MADQNQDRCHYATLGVSKTATQIEIKKAYSKLVLVHHPDKGGNPQIFIKVQAAYEVLRDPESRQAYDKKQQAAQFRGAAEPEVKVKTKKTEEFPPSPGTRRETRQERAERQKKESRAQFKQQQHEGQAEARRRRGKTGKQEQRPEPVFERGNEDVFEERRSPPDSFFGNDDFFNNDDFFGGDNFMSSMFNGPKKPAAERQSPTDENRNKPQGRAQARARDGEPRQEKFPFRETGYPFHEPAVELDEATLESLLTRAQKRCEHFNHTFSKLYATTGPFSSGYGDVWCHLQRVKALLAKSLLQIELAQRDHALAQLRIGVKEGTLKPPRGVILALSSKLDSDYGVLKGTGELMFGAYSSARYLSYCVQKNMCCMNPVFRARQELFHRAMRDLHKHLKKNLLQQ